MGKLFRAVRAGAGARPGVLGDPAGCAVCTATCGLPALMDRLGVHAAVVSTLD